MVAGKTVQFRFIWVLLSKSNPRGEPRGALAFGFAVQAALIKSRGRYASRITSMYSLLQTIRAIESTEKKNEKNFIKNEFAVMPLLRKDYTRYPPMI